MVREDTPEEFLTYLSCKLALYPNFVNVGTVSPHVIYDEVLFREEFTYVNWLKGKIGKRLYKGELSTISTKGATIFNKLHQVKDKIIIQEGYDYSIYRFIKYNFKRKVYFNGNRLK